MKYRNRVTKVDSKEANNEKNQASRFLDALLMAEILIRSLCAHTLVNKDRSVVSIKCTKIFARASKWLFPTIDS